MAIFLDDEYLGNYSDQDEESETIEESEKKIEIGFALLRFEIYNYLGPSSENESSSTYTRVIRVSKEKIMRKIKW